MTSGSLIFPRQKNDPSVERGIRFANVSSRPGGVTPGRASSVQQIISLPTERDRTYSGVVRYRRVKVPFSVLADEYRNKDEFGNIIFPFTGGYFVGPTGSVPIPGTGQGHIFDGYTVALWRFDEDTASIDPVDETENTVLQQFRLTGEGTVAGAAPVVSGIAGLARDVGEVESTDFFQGVGNETLGDAFNGDWTIEMWMKPSEGTDHGSETLFFYAGANWFGDSVQDTEGILASLFFQNGTTEGNRQVGFNFQEKVSGTINTFLSNADIDPDAWNHIALSRELYDTSRYNYRIYINGVLDLTANNVTEDDQTLELVDPPGGSDTHRISVGNTHNDAVLGAAPQSVFEGRLDDLRVSNIRRSNLEIFESYERGAGISPPTIPTGSVVALHSHRVTGSNGDKISTWANSGTIADFVQATDAYKPMLLKNVNENAISFDGIFDVMTSPGSATETGFVMSTGVFDLVLALRRTNNLTAQERRICGNCEGQAGISVLLNGDGNLWVILGNGSGLISNFVTTVNVPLGEPTKILVRGDGTQIRVSTDFSTFEDQAFAAALGSGDAFYDFTVGGSNPSQTTPRTFEGDMYEVILYDRNLSGAELTQMSSYLDRYVADGI